LFLLYRHVDLPHLHSFPTRRSSDLDLTGWNLTGQNLTDAKLQRVDGHFKLDAADFRGATGTTLPPAIPNLQYTIRPDGTLDTLLDRKSTRLNSSHVAISYAVFCLKK